MRSPASSSRTVVAVGCALALACDGVSEPSNGSPVIAAVTPDPVALLPEGAATLTCVASDPDADELRYVWGASAGVLSGTGPIVSWTSPAEDGTYVVTVTVTDGRGGTASDSALVDVIGGTFLLRTREGVFAWDVGGGELQLTGPVWAGPEVWDDRIFVYVEISGYIYELDHQGNGLMQVRLPEQVQPRCLDFVALPGDRFACLDNVDDQIDFVSAAGELLATVAMPVPSPNNINQNVRGVVVGNRLIVQEMPPRKILSVDLDSYEVSVFRHIYDDWNGWLGDIDYQDGVFYLTRALRLQPFTEEGPAEAVVHIATVPEGNLVAVAVVGRYAFAVINHTGQLVRFGLDDGGVVLLRDDLDYPEDIEYLRRPLSGQ